VLDGCGVSGKQLHVTSLGTTADAATIVVSRENLHNEDKLRRDLGAALGDGVRVADGLGALSVVGAGINAGVGMAPLLPGVSDKPEMLETVVRAARDAGATQVWANVLYLSPGTREHFLSVLERHWPQESARYQKLYANRAYLPKSETEPITRQVVELRSRLGIRDRRSVKLAPPPEPDQLDLAI